ncbi:MAG: type II/IV secretion system protein, partial [Candidatus Eisenbacteria bacterium]
ASSVSRLLEMGIEAYLLASSLAGVLSQRLVRTLCPDCAAEYYPSPVEMQTLSLPERTGQRLRRGRGCSACFDSGYRGRIGIYEMLSADDELRRLLLSEPTMEKLRQHQGRDDAATLRSEGLRRVLEGKTTLEEIARAVQLE